MGGRRTLRRIILVVVVAAALLTGGAGFLIAGTVAAAGYQRAAQDVLATVGADEGGVADLLRAPDLHVEDLSNARTGLGEAEAKVRAARGKVQTDRRRLSAASAALAAQSQNPLVLLERSPLTAERGRLDSLNAAFGVADEALAAADGHIQLVLAVMDSDAAYGPLVPKLKAGDFKGALALYPQVESATQKEMALANGPNVPPALRARASTDAAYAADNKRYLMAVQARDFRTADAIEPHLDAELNAMHLDSASLRAYEEQLFSGFARRFNAAVKASGIVGAPPPR